MFNRSLKLNTMADFISWSFPKELTSQQRESIRKTAYAKAQAENSKLDRVSVSKIKNGSGYSVTGVNKRGTVSVYYVYNPRKK